MGPMDPKKQMRFAERMGKGKYTNLYTTCLVRSCFCLLCRVCLSFPCMRVFSCFFMERSHIKVAQKKVSKSSSSTTSANICNLCFSTYPARPIMTWEAPPSSYVYVCFTQLSPQEQPRHNSSAAACSSAGASASATASEAGSWQWS